MNAETQCESQFTGVYRSTILGLLTLVYYECPMLCTLTLNSLSSALATHPAGHPETRPAVSRAQQRRDAIAARKERKR